MRKHKFSKAEIIRLGNRLREDNETQDDLKLLDQFRESFGEDFKIVIKKLREIIDDEDCIINDRQTKTRKSIKDKLKRMKSLKLTQMQDIRGCRIVIREGGLVKIQSILCEIKANFDEKKLKIKERDDEIGYRAIHIIVKENNSHIEIQIRTKLQDLWANLCEKYSSNDNDLKYGARETKIKNTLKKYSGFIKNFEKMEWEHEQRESKIHKNTFLFFKSKNYKKWFEEKNELNLIKKKLEEITQLDLNKSVQ